MKFVDTIVISNSYSFIIVIFIFTIVHSIESLNVKKYNLMSLEDNTIIHVNYKNLDRLRKCIIFGLQSFTDFSLLILLTFYIFPICFKILNDEPFSTGLSNLEMNILYISSITVLATYVVELIWCVNVNFYIFFHHGIVILTFLFFSVIVIYNNFDQIQIYYIILTCMLLACHAAIDFLAHWAMYLFHGHKLGFFEINKYTKYLFYLNVYFVMIFRIFVNVLLFIINKKFISNYNILANNKIFYWFIFHVIAATMLFLVQFKTAQIHYILAKKVEK